MLHCVGAATTEYCLTDETKTQHISEMVDSWENALKLLDKYPWQNLFPLVVHPEFRELVLKAVVARYKLEKQRNSPRLPNWKTSCSVVGGEPLFRTRKDSKGSFLDASLLDDLD